MYAVVEIIDGSIEKIVDISENNLDKMKQVCYDLNSKSDYTYDGYIPVYKVYEMTEIDVKEHDNNEEGW